VVPSIHFECRVNLFAPFIAPERSYHLDAVQIKESVQEIFEEIAAFLWISVSCGLFELSKK
jgi:hypothetical protein